MRSGSTLTVVFLLLSSSSEGYVPLINVRLVTRSPTKHLLRGAKGQKGSEHSHRWRHEPFDFSSRFGWDDFYKQGLRHEDPEISSEVEDGDTEDSSESLEYEWHAHIPHSAVVDAIAPTISAAQNHYATINPDSQTKSALPSILLIGCGNSALPRILHDAFGTPVQVTCLDYSPVCIEMIRSMYEPSCPNMNFVVGDATKLQHIRWGREMTEQSPGMKYFDAIVDKGLLDALMCGEGFDLETLMESVNSVLTPRDWGMHVLICFQLSKASKKSLAGSRNSDGDPDLFWDFDVPVEGSEKGRATFNLACRSEERYENGFEIEQITTEWI